MDNVYLVYDCSFGSCSVLGAYTSRELADQAMVVWVDQENANERELSAFHHEDPEELELYTATYDKNGELMYEKSSHYRVSVEEHILNTPCISAYQKWKQEHQSP